MFFPMGLKGNRVPARQKILRGYFPEFFISFAGSSQDHARLFSGIFYIIPSLRRGYFPEFNISFPAKTKATGILAAF